MAFPVVLDTCVLYPAHLRDTLLRLAEIELYQPLWSAAILDELQRNLLKRNLDPGAVGRTIGLMQSAFPSAEVAGYEGLEDGLLCHSKDRHVLAAAVRANAEAIVTFNLSDFPDQSVDHLEIEVIHPDDFLLDLFDLSPLAVGSELEAQARANRREPKSVAALLDAIAMAGAPKFADAVGLRPS